MGCLVYSQAATFWAGDDADVCMHLGIAQTRAHSFEIHWAGRSGADPFPARWEMKLGPENEEPLKNESVPP